MQRRNKITILFALDLFASNRIMFRIMTWTELNNLLLCARCRKWRRSLLHDRLPYTEICDKILKFSFGPILVPASMRRVRDWNVWLSIHFDLFISREEKIEENVSSIWNCDGRRNKVWAEVFEFIEVHLSPSRFRTHTSMHSEADLRRRHSRGKDYARMPVKGNDVRKN